MKTPPTVRDLRPCPAVEIKYIEQLSTGTWRTFKPVIDNEKCLKCQLCELFCPEGVIVIIEGGISIDCKYCKGCGICAYECRLGAIKMVRETE